MNDPENPSKVLLDALTNLYDEAASCGLKLLKVEFGDGRCSKSKKRIWRKDGLEYVVLKVPEMPSTPQWNKEVFAYFPGKMFFMADSDRGTGG